MARGNAWAASGLALVLVITSCLCLAQTNKWVEQEVPRVNPESLSAAERQVWFTELDKLNEALEEINDPRAYEAGKYECNAFSDFSAAKLAEKGFTVKRAMRMDFASDDGTRVQHHWVFVIIRVREKELWVPIECTPPEGERQKNPDRVRQFPDIPDEVYIDSEGKEVYGERFDERYFGKVMIKDVSQIKEGAARPGPTYYEVKFRVVLGETLLMTPWGYCPPLWSAASQGRSVTAGTPVVLCFVLFGVPVCQLVGTTGSIGGVTFELASPGTGLPSSGTSSTSLPAGVQFNGGIIYGIPTQTGTWHLLIFAKETSTREIIAGALVTLVVEAAIEDCPTCPPPWTGDLN